MDLQTLQHLASQHLEELNKAREYHFHRMHVYVNALFQTDPRVDNVYRFYPISEIGLQDHVHIFLWNTNATDEIIFRMADFIHYVTNVSKKPTMIHMPKVAIRMISRVRGYLSHYANSNPVNYRIIEEDLSTINSFKYGDFIPNPNGGIHHIRMYDSMLRIKWDPREMALPYFNGKHDEKDYHRTKFVYPIPEYERRPIDCG